MTKAKVGDKVFFKKDYEGTGYVLEIRERKGFFGPQHTYVVGTSMDPNRRDCYRWHSEAQDDYKLLCAVIYLEDYDNFEIL